MVKRNAGGLREIRGLINKKTFEESVFGCSAVDSHTSEFPVEGDEIMLGVKPFKTIVLPRHSHGDWGLVFDFESDMEKRKDKGYNLRRGVFNGIIGRMDFLSGGLEKLSVFSTRLTVRERYL
jgi:hypothetical protein